MRVITSERFADWTRGTGILALVVLAWAALVPGGLFWAVVLAVGLIGAALATAVLMHSRRIPSLAQVIATAEAEPAADPGRGRSSQASRRSSPGSTP